MSAESVTIEVRCSKSGRMMRVGFARLSPWDAFEVEAVLPGSGVSASVGGARLAAPGGSVPEKTIYVDNTSRQRDAMEFDWSMFQCIHCEERPELPGVMQCGACDSLLCTGTLRAGRGDRFKYSCGVCGAKSSGRFSGGIEAFSARPGHAGAPSIESGKRGLLDQARNLLPGSEKDR